MDFSGRKDSSGCLSMYCYVGSILSHCLNFALGKSSIKRCEDQLLLDRSFEFSGFDVLADAIRVAGSCA